MTKENWGGLGSIPFSIKNWNFSRKRAKKGKICNFTDSQLPVGVPSDQDWHSCKVSEKSVKVDFFTELYLVMLHNLCIKRAKTKAFSIFRLRVHPIPPCYRAIFVGIKFFQFNLWRVQNGRWKWGFIFAKNRTSFWPCYGSEIFPLKPKPAVWSYFCCDKFFQDLTSEGSKNGLLGIFSDFRAFFGDNRLEGVWWTDQSSCGG